MQEPAVLTSVVVHGMPFPLGLSNPLPGVRKDHARAMVQSPMEVTRKAWPV